jgi:hypothetical protein
MQIGMSTPRPLPRPSPRRAIHLRWSIALGFLAACGGTGTPDAPALEQQSNTIVSGGAPIVVGSGGATGSGGVIAAATDAGASQDGNVGAAGSGGIDSGVCPALVHTPPSAECKPSRNVQSTLIHGVPSYPVDAIPSGSCADTEPTCLFASTQLCPPSYAFGSSNFFSCSCVAGSWCCTPLGPNANACAP